MRINNIKTNRNLQSITVKGYSPLFAKEIIIDDIWGMKTLKDAPGEDTLILTLPHDFGLEKRSVIKVFEGSNSKTWLVERIDSRHTGDGISVEVYCEAIIYGLSSYWIDSLLLKNSYVQYVVDELTKSTPYKIDVIGDAKTKPVSVTFENQNAYSCLVQLMDNYGLRVNDEIISNTSRNIRMESIDYSGEYIINSQWGVNILEATKTVNEDLIVNRLYVEGGVNEDGENIKLPEKFIQDEESISKYGVCEGFFSVDETDIDKIREKAFEELNNKKQPKVSYQLNLFTGNQSLSELEKLNVGAKTLIIDEALFGDSYERRADVLSVSYDWLLKELSVEVGEYSRQNLPFNVKLMDKLDKLKKQNLEFMKESKETKNQVEQINGKNRKNLIANGRFQESKTGWMTATEDFLDWSFGTTLGESNINYGSFIIDLEGILSRDFFSTCTYGEAHSRYDVTQTITNLEGASNPDAVVWHYTLSFDAYIEDGRENISTDAIRYSLNPSINGQPAYTIPGVSVTAKDSLGFNDKLNESTKEKPVRFQFSFPLDQTSFDVGFGLQVFVPCRALVTDTSFKPQVKPRINISNIQLENGTKATPYSNTMASKSAVIGAYVADFFKMNTEGISVDGNGLIRIEYDTKLETINDVDKERSGKWISVKDLIEIIKTVAPNELQNRTKEFTETISFRKE